LYTPTLLVHAFRGWRGCGASVACFDLPCLIAVSISGDHFRRRARRLTSRKVNQHPIGACACDERVMLVELIMTQTADASEATCPCFDFKGVLMIKRLQIFDMCLTNQPAHIQGVVAMNVVTYCVRGFNRCFLHVARVA